MWGTQPQHNKNTVPVKTASLTDIRHLIWTNKLAKKHKPSFTEETVPSACVR